MNPIRNKKDLEATVDEIRNFSYSYLEKYCFHLFCFGIWVLEYDL